MRIATLVCAVLVAACGSLAPSSGGPTVSPSAAAAAASATPSGTAGPTVVPPSIANSALADLMRQTGRSDLRVCLYVDPATGADPSQFLALLSSTVDGLRSKGYSVISAPPAPCPQPTLFLRTNTVHPKNSGQGPVGPGARVVATPDAFLLHVAVTTNAQLARIFGGLSTRRGAEEITCTGDNCREITSAIYTDPVEFQNAARRERLLLTGLGLLGP